MLLVDAKTVARAIQAIANSDEDSQSRSSDAFLAMLNSTPQGRAFVASLSEACAADMGSGTYGQLRKAVGPGMYAGLLVAEYLRNEAEKPDGNVARVH